MGQQVVYCFKCQSRLVGSDVEKGGAIRILHRPACKPCVQALADSPVTEERSAARAALQPPPPSREIPFR